eukprot:scaffold11622_cov63-Phaeocystis_antarctica.AAC.4
MRGIHKALQLHQSLNDRALYGDRRSCVLGLLGFDQSQTFSERLECLLRFGREQGISECREQINRLWVLGHRIPQRRHRIA